MGNEAFKLVGRYRNGKPIDIPKEIDPKILKLRREVAKAALKKVAEQWLKNHG